MEYLIELVDDVADFYVNLFDFIVNDFLSSVSIIIVNMIIIICSPAWVGPYLVWRNYRDRD